MPITSVKFRNFKALHDYSISLQRMNVVVGPNNSGKSTVLSAFRVLEQGLRTARSRSASSVRTHTDYTSKGHILSPNTIPISLENVHSDYAKSDSVIEFRYYGGNKIYFFFPADGGVTMYWDTAQRTPTTPRTFSKVFPDIVQTIPVLGPVEQHERIVTDNTVRRAAGTPRASRHFRNYWRKNPHGFNEFRRLVEDTWPGMSIVKPELADILDDRLAIFATENRIARELYWAGLGFQVWCQLLTHISRCSESDVLVVDEPEVYLHPEVQRRLVEILRGVRPDIVLATHSVEILGEADAGEILLVDKFQQSARRLRDVDGVQQALEKIGSIQNITLTEVARNRRIVFVEGLYDYKIMRRFAKTLGLGELAAGTGIVALESGGFESWTRVEGLALGFRGPLRTALSVAAIYDRDYRCDEESTELKTQLEKAIQFAHFHERKEIENYLLSPEILERAVIKASEERARRMGEPMVASIDVVGMLESITSEVKTECSGQYVGKYCTYLKFSGRDQATLATEALTAFEKKWANMETRLEIVPGKHVLKAVRRKVKDVYGVTLTDWRIVDCYRAEEVPEDLTRLLLELNRFRQQ